MTEEQQLPSASTSLSEDRLLAIALSQTAYQLNNGFGIQPEKPLRFFDDLPLIESHLARPLNLSFPEGFVVSGVIKNPQSGLDAFVAANKSSGKILIGIAGTNGFGNDLPDTKEDLVSIGAGHAAELYRSSEFLEVMKKSIDFIGGTTNVTHVLVAGQSLGGGGSVNLGQLLALGMPKFEDGASLEKLGIPIDTLSVFSINGPGNEYSSKILGFSADDNLRYKNLINPQRLSVCNSKSNVCDLVTQTGGNFSGSTFMLEVEVAQSVPELHRNGFGVAEALERKNNDLSDLKEIAVPTLDHATLTRNLAWINQQVPIASNYISLSWSSYVAMLFSKPGEGAATMSLGLQRFAGIAKPLADAMGFVGELALRYVPVTQLAQTVKFLFGAYLAGQSIGSLSSPVPAFDAESVFGPPKAGWDRVIRRQDTSGFSPIVIDRNPVDGTVVTRLTDGRSIEVHTDGTEILTHPESGLAIIRPDKSGVLILKNTDSFSGDTQTSTVILDPSMTLSFENQRWVTRRLINADTELIEQTTYEGNRSFTEDVQVRRSENGSVIGFRQLDNPPFVSELPSDGPVWDDGLTTYQLAIPLSPDHVQLVFRDEDRRLVQTIDIKTPNRFRSEEIFRDCEGYLQKTIIREKISDGIIRTRTLDSDGNEIEQLVSHTYRLNGEIVLLEDRVTVDGRRTLTTLDSQHHVKSTEILPLDAKPDKLVEVQRHKLQQDVADFLTALRQRDTAGTLLATARIALDYARSEGMVTARLDDLVGDVSSGLALVNSLHSIRSGDTLAQIGGTVGLLNSTNDLAASHFGGAYLTGAQTTALSTAAAILSIATLSHLGDMLAAGQPGSAAASVVSAVNAISHFSGGTALSGAGALIPINPIAMVVAAYVLDELFSSDPPPPPPTGTVRFVRKSDGELSYRIENANSLGRSILQRQMDSLLPELESQIAAANTVITTATHRLQWVASRMPAIHIASWPSRDGNGISNFYFAIEQVDPMRDNPRWLGVAQKDLVAHYAETLLLPEAAVQQWEIDHLRAKFGTDDTHWPTESAWARQRSPIEQERSRLQVAFEQAKEHWQAASAATLVASDLGEVKNTNSRSLHPPLVEALRSEALRKMEAAQSAVESFNTDHPANPALAARATPQQEAEFGRAHALSPAVALQWTQLVTVDIAGDGISVTDLPDEVGTDLDSITHQRVARFDVDGDGFREATQWVSPSEAILGIDRSGNGLLDNSSELFNAADVPFDQQGLRSLAFFDANADGLINRDDPAYALLRLWIDLDGDGSPGALEVFDMNFRPMAMPADRLPYQPMTSMSIDAIHLRDNRLTFADGSTAGISDVKLLSYLHGLQVAHDGMTANLNVLHEDGLRENFITMVDDMSALTELQSPTLPTDRRAELEALAKRYGLNPGAQEFADIVRSLRSAAASADQDTVIYFGDESVWVDPGLREELADMRIRFRKLVDGSPADHPQLARLGTRLDMQSIGTNGAFDDHWVASRKLCVSDILSDPVTSVPSEQSNSVLSALPSDVYSLLEISKGAQEGGFFTRQAIPISDPAGSQALAQAANVYLTQQLVTSLPAMRLIMNEDAVLCMERAQIEQQAAAQLGSTYTPLTLLGLRNSSHGSASIDSEKTLLQFRPQSDFVGDASLTVVLADALGRLYEQRLILGLQPVNDAPMVLGEQVICDEDVPLLIESAMLLANDQDPEGDTLTITGIGHVALGKAELLANGMIHYIPPADQYGVTDTVDYFVSDTHGATSIAKIRLSLTPVEDAPSVVSERVINAHEDQVVRIAAALLLANDFDTDTDARTGSQLLRIAAAGSAAHGEVRLEDGEIVFRPERDYNGLTTFSYTVTDASGRSTIGHTQIRIDPVTDAPLVADETIASVEDQTLMIDTSLLLANDIDPDILMGEKQTLSVIAIDQVSGGTARLRDGHIVFTPDANRFGLAGFRYTVSDGASGLAQGNARIMLAAVNDAPVVPVIQASSKEDQPLSIMISTLVDNATDVDDLHAQLRFAGINKVSGGSVVRKNDELIFTPDKDYVGTAIIEYQIADPLNQTTTGVYVIDISNVNDAPLLLEGVKMALVADEDQDIRISETALLQMFIDSDSPTLRVLPESLRAISSGDLVYLDASTREVVFHPKSNANGDRFIYFAVTDGQLTSPNASVKLQLRPVNDAPVVRAPGFRMLEDGGETDPTRSAWTYISHDLLLSGARDPDGDPLQIASVRNGLTLSDGWHRQVIVENDPKNRRVMIKAPLNYVGTTNFEFTVVDGKGGSTTQTALGSIQEINDNPFMAYQFQTTLNWPIFPNHYALRSYHVDVWDPDHNQSITLSIDKNPLRGEAGLYPTQGYTAYATSGAEADALNSTERTCLSGVLNIFVTSGTAKYEEQVSIKATDSSGGSTTSIVSFTGYYDPVIIDLDNDGLEFIDLDHSSVSFITELGGESHRMAWVGSDDGILAYDVDGDGEITRFDEISFGQHVSSDSRGISDLQALQNIEFDSNQDGIFDAEDPRWAQFRLWRDRNSNGKSDEGELQTMPQAGLCQLFLSPNVLNRFEGPDVLVRGYTRAVTSNGRLLQAADVWLNVDDGSRIITEPALPQEAIAIDTDHLTALLEQLATTPTGNNHAPLLYGYLPTQYADAGEFFHLEVAPNLFIDPDVGDRLTFVATLADGSALPEWLSFNATSLRFEGLPIGSDARQWQVLLRATDPKQASSTTGFNLVVSPTSHVQSQPVTPANSLWLPEPGSYWNALLPADVIFSPEATSLVTAQGVSLSASDAPAWSDSSGDNQEHGKLPAMPQTSRLTTATYPFSTNTDPQPDAAELFQDFIQGTLDNDDYVFSVGNRWQTLLDPGGDDLIRINVADASSHLRFEQQGSDLSVAIADTSDGLRISRWYERDDSGVAIHQIERFQLLDGRTLMAGDVDKLIAAQATAGMTSVGQFWQ